MVSADSSLTGCKAVPAYLDMIGGVSGDMLLGAVVDAGVEISALQAELEKMPARGYRLSADKVRRGGLSATFVNVELDKEGERTRTWNEFTAAIESSSLPSADKAAALAVFDTLAEAEAAAHGGQKGSTHLHELGTVDTLVDVVGAIAGLRMLGISTLHASPFPSGSGSSRSSHGALAATSLATMAIYQSKGVPVRAGGPAGPYGESVTPTGAAVVATIAAFSPAAMVVTRVGYGAGSRNPDEYPNVAGLWLGDAVGEQDEAGPLHGGLVLLETNIDDMPGELFGYVQERLFEAGARDVWFTPIQMKKNRPGVLLSALAPAERAGTAARLILSETSTLGVRSRPVERYEAEREITTVNTSLGTTPVKVKRLGGVILEVSPEYDACREIASATGLPLREVMRRVQAEAAEMLA
ncbi:MAG: nickel pincer cofactor biosynthesis protein LarC [Dehalococcoidia bacterium]